MMLDRQADVVEGREAEPDVDDDEVRGGQKAAEAKKEGKGL